MRRRRIAMSRATWDERRLDVDLLLEYMEMHWLMQCFHVNNTRHHRCGCNNNAEKDAMVTIACQNHTMRRGVDPKHCVREKEEQLQCQPGDME